MISQGRIYTEQIILVGLTGVIEKEVTPTPWNNDAFYYSNDIEKYNLVLKKIASKNSLLFIPMDDVLEDSDFEDGLHPNSEGHKKMFERIKEFLLDNKVI